MSIPIVLLIKSFGTIQYLKLKVMKTYHNEDVAYKDFSFISYWPEQAINFNSDDDEEYDLDDEALDDAEATKTD